MPLLGSAADRLHRWRRSVPSDLTACSLWLLLGAIVIGAALRVHQFTADTSLWLDELAIANNLAERSLWSLLREPLGYAQVAPPGFILIEKVMYEVFGANDRALRLYSLIAGVGALGAILLIALRVGLRQCAWVAPLLLALGGPFIFQSAQVKPYAGDLFLSLTLVAVALRLGTHTEAGRVWPAALGILAPWFSFAAALTLAGIGLVLFASPQRRRVVPIVALWGLSTVAALFYANGLVDPGTAASMHAFWSSNGMGFPNGGRDVLPWLSEQLRAHLWTDVGLRGVTYWLGIAGVGAVVLWRHDRYALAVITAPVLMAVVAATLHRYPLGGRLSLTIAAVLIMLIVAAAEAAARVLHRLKLGTLSPIPGAVVAALPVMSLAAALPPYRVDDVKPVLAEIGRRRQADDWLYVYPGAWHAHRYYGALSGFSPQRVVFGHCHTATMRESLAPLDTLLGGARVWVLFAHVSMPSDREFLLSYLDHVGARRRTLAVPGLNANASSAVDAHLYDLSAPMRLRTATPSTHSIGLNEAPNDSPVCSSGMLPGEISATARVTRTGEVVLE